MSSLYKLSAEVAALKEKLENSDLDAQTIADTLEAESFDFEEKCKAIAYVIKEFEAKEMALSDAIEEMEHRERAIRNRVDHLKTYLQDSMIRAGKRKVEGVEFDVAIRKNPQSVDVFDHSLVPPDFWIKLEPTRAVDKKGIRQKLQSGENVPGCRLVQTERIEIK